MALQTSGPISLNDIHVEAGGSSGTNCTINDADIRGLISKASGATMSFNEWYGASAGPVPNATMTVTVGNDATQTYPFRGVAETNTLGNYSTGGTYPAFGSGSSGWNTTGGVIPGVRIKGITLWNFPAQGNPEFRFSFDTSQTDPTTSSTYANLTMRVSSGSVVSGPTQLPIGSSARSSYPATYPTKIGPSIEPNTSNASKKVGLRSCYETSQGHQYIPLTFPSSNGTVWTVDFFW